MSCGPESLWTPEGRGGLDSRGMVLGAVEKSLPLKRGVGGTGMGVPLSCEAPGHAQHRVRYQGPDSKL